MITVNLSMRARPRSLASSLQIAPSLRRKDSSIPRIFFRKTISRKGWGSLCQPPTSAATMVVSEFYANLATHMLKKVRVRGVLVYFSLKSINAYYNLEPVNTEPYDRLYANPNYPEILRMLTNGQGEWKLNNERHVVHFKAKHLAYIPKVWHHCITSHLIPTMNVCEVTEKGHCSTTSSFRTSRLMSVKP